MIRFNKKIMGLRDSDNYRTPKDFYKRLNAEFHFDFDPCPYKADFDGLVVPWRGSVFVNPPYSSIEPFVTKGIQELACGNAHTIVYLLPCRTDVRYFHNLIYGKAELRFIKGRLNFNDAKTPSPFPVYLAIFKKDAPAVNSGAEPVQRLTAAGQNTGNTLELDL